jgi:hypothetical protein
MVEMFVAGSVGCCVDEWLMVDGRTVSCVSCELACDIVSVCRSSRVFTQVVASRHIGRHHVVTSSH